MKNNLTLARRKVASSESSYVKSLAEYSKCLANIIKHDLAKAKQRRRLRRSDQLYAEARAKVLLAKAHGNKSLRVLHAKKDRPLIFLLRAPSRMPRVPRQQDIFLFMAHESLAQSPGPLRWLKKNLYELALQAPRYTQFSLSPKFDSLLAKTLFRAGFTTRYELSVGATDVALRQLIKVKNPPSDLIHLNLEIKEIEKLSELRKAIRVQALSSRRAGWHGYFSHSSDQLKKDFQEYRMKLKQNQALLLGIYRNERVLGLMTVTLHQEGRSKTFGGLSFFIHPSVQGKGVANTGYLHLLKFMKERQVKSFTGGTSQPAIQSLAKIMRRKTERVLFLKTCGKT